MPDPTPSETLRQGTPGHECIDCARRGGLTIEGGRVILSCQLMPEEHRHESNMVCDLWENESDEQG